MRGALAGLIVMTASAGAGAAPPEPTEPAPQMAAPTIDDAFPPTLRVRSSHVSRVTVAVRSAPDVTWIGLDIQAPRGGDELAIPLDLPAGAQVVSMTLAHGDGASVLGRLRDCAPAIQALANGDAPAAAVWTGSSGGEDHLVVRGRGSAHVELAVALPVLASLVVDTNAKLAASIDGEPVRGRTLDLHAIAAVHASYPRVNEDRTLIADTRDPDGTPTVTIPQPDHDASCYFGTGTRSIRREVHAHEAQLRRCYMVEAQRDPSLAGTVMLRFVIDDTGAVTTAEASGDLPPSVTDCLVAQAKRWEFPGNQRAGTAMINYPLTFRLR